MPAILDPEDDALPTELPFPPVTREHIMNCSYHSWWPKYKSITPKSRLIPLTAPFLSYLRADGIILPDDEEAQATSQSGNWEEDSGIYSASDDLDDEGEGDEDVSAPWREVHNAIRRTIDDLGGKVVPKLNWSAPKDATWMAATNDMTCRTPNDIYLLLKSSDFVTHDLEHAFSDTVATSSSHISQSEIPYYLVLRKYFAMNPSVEFRCFVRNRKLLCLCQRDLNHYDFLQPMESKLVSLIQEFFDVRLRETFEDADFVFDCYVPNPYNRVWLVDINPWAPRTDPLLYSWLEILGMDEPPDRVHEDHAEEEEAFIRLSLRDTTTDRPAPDDEHTPPNTLPHQPNSSNTNSDSEDDEEVDDDLWLPELRLVKKSDPEAYNFSTQQYSAHKLPRDVVQAAESGEGLREFARDWRDILARRQAEEAEGGSSGGEEGA